MLRRVHRAVCRNCMRNLPRAAARCPWCSYGRDETSKPNAPRQPDDTLSWHAMRRMLHRERFNIATL